MHWEQGSMQISSAMRGPMDTIRFRTEHAVTARSPMPNATFDSDAPADHPTGEPTSRMSVRDAKTGRSILFGSGDRDADDAFTNGGTVLDFLHDVLGRDSIDGAGMLVRFTVRDESGPGNAWWDGRGIKFGPADGGDFLAMEGALDVVAHELTHGVNERTNGLVYRGQSGALDESFADVMGEAVQIWQEQGRTNWSSADVARQHDWSSGEYAVTGTRIDAISDLANPGRDGVYAKQPGHMRDFREMQDDNGGVHINSGIPNKAAHEAAIRIGAEQMIKVWYAAFSTRLDDHSQFDDAAEATIAAARELYGDTTSAAVRDAWRAVGL
jgi:Zn-dependent metalloprotease